MIAKLKFPLEAGALVRGQARQIILAEAKWYDVTVSLFEDKGLLDSSFEVILNGEQENCTKAYAAICRRLRSLS